MQGIVFRAEADFPHIGCYFHWIDKTKTVLSLYLLKIRVGHSTFSSSEPNCERGWHFVCESANNCIQQNAVKMSRSIKITLINDFLRTGSIRLYSLPTDSFMFEFYFWALDSKHRQIFSTFSHFFCAQLFGRIHFEPSSKNQFYMTVVIDSIFETETESLLVEGKTLSYGAN